MISVLHLVSLVFFFLLFSVSVFNFLRTGIVYYLLLSVSILSAIVGVFFDIFASLSVVEEVARGNFKLAAVSFTISIFLFTLFLLNSSKIGSKVVFYIMIAALFGVEFYDVIIFDVVVRRVDSTFELVAPRSFIGYLARIIMFGLGLALFIFTAIRFLLISRYRRRKILVAMVSSAFMMIFLTSGFYPMMYYGSFSIRVQVVGIVFSFILISLLMTLDPFLLVIWSGELKAFMVYREDGLLLFSDYVDLAFASLASSFLTAMFNFAEEMMFGEKHGLRKIIIKDQILEIYTYKSIYVAILHRNMPQIFELFIQQFLRGAYEATKNMIGEEGLIMDTDKITKILEEIYEREILQKIF